MCCFVISCFLLLGEVDLDGSCLVFNKFGYLVENVFWDNLVAFDGAIEHLGDRVVLGEEDEYLEDDPDEKDGREVENILIDVCNIYIHLKLVVQNRETYYYDDICN